MVELHSGLFRAVNTATFLPPACPVRNVRRKRRHAGTPHLHEPSGTCQFKPGINGKTQATQRTEYIYSDHYPSNSLHVPLQKDTHQSHRSPVIAFVNMVAVHRA